MLFIVHATVRHIHRGLYSDSETITTVTHAVEAEHADQACSAVRRHYESKSGDGPYDDRYEVEPPQAYEFLNAAEVLSA
jgi:hypothetical protein